MPDTALSPEGSAFIEEHMKVDGEFPKLQTIGVFDRCNKGHYGTTNKKERGDLHSEQGVKNCVPGRGKASIRI